MRNHVYTFGDYKSQAMALANHDLDPHIAREYAVLGLMGEAGELCDMVKKVMGQGHPETDDWRRKLKLELGDLMWYVAYTSYHYGASVHALEPAPYIKAFERGIPLLPLCQPGRACRAIMRQVVEIDKLGAGHAYIIGCKLGRIAVEVARIGRAYGFDLPDILQSNLDKLNKRYPNGFEAERSIHRQA